MDEDIQQFTEKHERFCEHIPGIEAQVTADVYTKGIQAHHHEYDEQREGTAAYDLQYGLNFPDGKKAEQQSVPGKGEYQQQIKPPRCVVEIKQMKKVCDDIKCIRDERQPDQQRQREQPFIFQHPYTCAQPLADGIRNKCQEEVPYKKEISDLACRDHTRCHQHAAECTGDQQPLLQREIWRIEFLYKSFIGHCSGF